MRTARAPRGYVIGALDSVSCASPTSCTAVGVMAHARYRTATVPLVEWWDWRTWTIEPTALRTPAAMRRIALADRDYNLYAVSCVAVSDCVAVGYGNEFETDTGIAAPIAGHWSGQIWRIGPAAGKQGIPLDGVSCASASACTAVAAGDITGGSLQIETWTGTH